VAGALRGVPPDAAQADPPSTPLPLSARALLLNLREGKLASADALAVEADALLRSPASIERGRRLVQLGVTSFAVVVLPIVVVTGMRMQVGAGSSNPAAFTLDAATDRLNTLDRKIRAKAAAEDIAERDALEAYISGRLREEVTEAGRYASSFPAVSSVRKTYTRAAQAIEHRPKPTAEEIAKGDAAAAAVKENQTAGLIALLTGPGQWAFGVLIAAGTACFFGALSLIGAFAVRGFTFRAFNFALVTGSGAQASRLRVAWRAVVTWSPALAAFLIARALPEIKKMTTSHALLLTLPLLVLGAGAAWTILRPSRGIQDRLAGTWIVPR
jgi:hypothetical protein